MVSEDGSLASSFVVPGDVSLIASEFVGADREVLLMTRFPSGSGYVFSRMAENGAVRWSKPLEGISGNLNIRVRGLSDGRAMILIFDASKVQQRFYSVDGALIETREIAMPESKSSGASNWAQDGQGNQAFVLRFGTGSVDDSFGAMLFAQNGGFIKLVRYTLTDQCLSNCELLGLASGFAIAVRTQDGARLVLTSPLTNIANVEVALPGNFGARITNGRDDSILIAGGKSLRAVNASGVAVPAPSLIGNGIDTRTMLGTAMAEDGKSFVLLRDYTDGEFRTQLEAFDANRQKIWQATTGIVFNETPLLVADELRVCWLGAGNATVKCYDSANGALLATANIPLNLFGLQARMLPDGRLRMASIDANGLKIIDFSRSNQVSELSVAIERVQMIQHIGDSGSVLLATRVANTTDKFEWVLLGPSGQEKFRRPIAGGSPSFEFFGTYDFTGQILENDDVLLASPIQRPADFAVDVVLMNQNGVAHTRVNRICFLRVPERMFI